MIAATGRRRQGTARGVTLMELVLVLALLVVAGSLAMPAVVGAFGGVRLRRAGDLVTTRWAEARAQAIETGVVYQFRFSPDSGKYRVEPWVSPEESAAGASATRRSTANSSGAGTAGGAGGAAAGPVNSQTAASTSGEAAASKTLAESSTIETALPEPITFQGGQTAVQDRVRGERRVDALQASGQAWSTPILFFPDGSASTATIVLQNDASQYLRLTLRGLTGVARASGVMTREELDESSRTR
jgi:Tfp pilus assembly protein FimT